MRDHPSMHGYEPTADERRFLTTIGHIGAVILLAAALIVATVVLLDLTVWRTR